MNSDEKQKKCIMGTNYSTIQKLLDLICKMLIPLRELMSIEGASTLFEILGLPPIKKMSEQQSLQKAIEKCSQSLFKLVDNFEIKSFTDSYILLQNVFENLHEISCILTNIQQDQGDLEIEFEQRIYSFFTYFYLQRFSIPLSVLEVLDVFDEPFINYSSTENSLTDFRKINLSKLLQFIKSPIEHFESTYNWGSSDLDTEKLLSNILRMMITLRVISFIEDLDGVNPTIITPFFRVRRFIGIAADELGLSILPGLPLEKQIQMEYDWCLKGWKHFLEFTGEIDSGTSINISPPANISFDTSSSKANNIETSFTIIGDSSELEGPFQIIGDESGTRVEVSSLKLYSEFKTTVKNNLLLGNIRSHATVNGGRVVIALPESGLLSQVSKNRDLTIDFQLKLYWSLESGFSFEGGAELIQMFTVNKQLGFIEIKSLTLALILNKSAIALKILTSLKANVGPLKIHLNNTGFEANLRTSDPNANLGPINLNFDLLLPEQVQVELDSENIQGGGYLDFDSPNYAGTLELSLQDKFDLAAFGLLTTELPDGKDGFSLVVQITAVFNAIQLGLGFALEGVGGIIGVNRRVHEENLRAGVFSNEFKLFPKRVIKDANKLISSIDKFFPAEDGSYVFGPALKMFWGGSNRIVNFEVGIFVQLGRATRVALVGFASSKLPSEEKALLKLNFQVFGLLDLSGERLAIDARLVDSKLLKFDLQGDMALRMSWGKEKYFVLSVGGFHPEFKDVPAGFPELRRVGLSWGGQNVKFNLDTYFAITPNTLQFGASFYLHASRFGGSITGYASFDAIFKSLYEFVVSIVVWVRIRAFGRTLASVRLELDIFGLNPIKIKGYASFKILWFRKKVRFSFSIGSKVSLPPRKVSVLKALLSELEERSAWNYELPSVLSGNVLLRSDQVFRVDPAGDLLLNQQVVPLGIELDRFADGIPTNSERKLTLKVNGVTESTPSIKEVFAPAQFIHFESEEEQLAAPTFESYDSGVRFGGDWIVPEPLAKKLSYEPIIIESEDYVAPIGELISNYCIVAVLDKEMEFLENWSGAVGANSDESKSSLAEDFKVQVIDAGYIAIDDDGAKQPETSVMSYAEAFRGSTHVAVALEDF